MCSSNIKSFHWTDEKCLQLIREFRNRPMLWDPKDPYYYKKTMKPAAWQEVADVLGVPAKSCKHKMVILMSSFRREKCRITQSLRENKTSPGVGHRVYKSGWFAFKEMAFLIDKAKKGDGDDEAENKSMDSNAILEYYIESPEPRPAKKQKLDTSETECEQITIKLEPSDNDEDYFDFETDEDPMPETILDEPSMPSTSVPRKPTDDDEITNFVNFIASKMRKYSARTKNAVQESICQIIFQADKDEANGGKTDTS